jgi:hypothetical protein
MGFRLWRSETAGTEIPYSWFFFFGQQVVRRKSFRRPLNFSVRSELKAADVSSVREEG